MHASQRASALPRIPVSPLAGLLGLWLLVGVGCATTSSTERQHLLERSAAQVAYRLPPEQVMGAAREILKERGYDIAMSADPLYVRTAWLAKFDETLDTAAVRERHFVVGTQLDDGRLVLTAYRLSHTTIGRTAPHPASSHKDEVTGMQLMFQGDPLSYARPVLVRDLGLEWQILSRVSPAVAHELESQADRYLATASR